MTRIISPEEFVSTFNSVVHGRMAKIIKLWDHKYAKEYTHLFLDPEQGILQEVARTFELNYRREYRRLDAVFFESQDGRHFSRQKNMPSFLTVAIEHESGARGSHDEVNKLSLTANAPLKVLITYPTLSSSSQYNEDRLLSTYAEIAQDADIFRDLSSSRRLVVVFGNNNGADISWRYFVYADGHFVPMETP